MAASSTTVANWFIERGKKDKKQFTQMQLQKLVYISHGWCLAILGKPLTSDNPEAWPYGPVYPYLYFALRKYGKDNVPSMITYSFDSPFPYGMADDDQLTKDEIEILENVYVVYGGFHAYQLSAMTHEEGTPWYQMYENEGRAREAIDKDRIKEHFIDLAKRRAS